MKTNKQSYKPRIDLYQISRDLYKSNKTRNTALNKLIQFFGTYDKIKHIDTRLYYHTMKALSHKYDHKTTHKKNIRTQWEHKHTLIKNNQLYRSTNAII